MGAQSRIVIICGKGGVGKTSLSLALALNAAARGRKALVVSSHPLRELAVSVSLEGLAERFPEAARNLFVVHLDPKELLAEVVEKNFPVRAVARAVLRSSIYRNLIEIAPGLKEFYFLARLQQLAERTAGGSREAPADFSLLVWDAPATGHFLGTLRAARSFETYLTGPLASAGAELARFLSNPAAIAVLPVTTLEEMAIEETIEMCRTLRAEFNLTPQALLLNLVSPMVRAPESDARALASTADSDPALRFASERGLLERERAADLRSQLAAETVAIERVRRFTGDLDLLDQVGRYLDAVPA